MAGGLLLHSFQAVLFPRLEAAVHFHDGISLRGELHRSVGAHMTNLCIAVNDVYGMPSQTSTRFPFFLGKTDRPGKMASLEIFRLPYVNDGHILFLSSIHEQSRGDNMLENRASATGCSPHLRFSWIKGHVHGRIDYYCCPVRDPIGNLAGDCGFKTSLFGCSTRVGPICPAKWRSRRRARVCGLRPGARRHSWPPENSTLATDGPLNTA